METRKLGQDLSVSALGYGCMGLSHAYGEALDEKEGSSQKSVGIQGPW